MREERVCEYYHKIELQELGKTFNFSTAIITPKLTDVSLDEYSTRIVSTLIPEGEQVGYGLVSKATYTKEIFEDIEEIGKIMTGESSGKEITIEINIPAVVNYMTDIPGVSSDVKAELRTALADYIYETARLNNVTIIQVQE